MVALGLWAISPPSLASELRCRLAPGNGEIHFELGATLHTVRGSCALEGGDLRFDPDSGVVVGEVIVDATSATTGNRMRDQTMHEQVLESEKFPQIALRAESLEIKERSAETLSGILSGRLELRGSSHEIRIPFEASGLSSQSARVQGRFDVPYVEWGLRDVSSLLLRVDKRVVVTVSVPCAVQSPALEESP